MGIQEMTSLIQLPKEHSGGFPWKQFNELFPFADISLSEGQFEELREESISLCNQPGEADALVDLVELQIVATIEQFDIQKMYDNVSDPEHYSDIDFEIERLVVKIQVISNVRSHNRLTQKDTRKMIFSSRASIIKRLTRLTN